MAGFIARLCSKHASWADDGTGFDEEPEGWHGLIEGLFATLGGEMEGAPDMRIEILEVSKRHGGLHCRCRTTDGIGALVGTPPGVAMALILAEALSFMVCEACGSLGRLRRDESGVLWTTCELHAPPGSEPVADGRRRSAH